ncbi:MAG: hypothetical protein J3R72DRAFT_499088 [Linnemannia gamsii]|nr:MAG: hypothetical protein J3R72DRAFT_499088 [Linnemannia gamsii]
MLSLGEGTFKWDAQEKRIIDGTERSDVMDSVDNRGSVRPPRMNVLGGPRPAYTERRLVPLEVVDIREHGAPFTDEVDDIVYTFSQTLTHLTAEASFSHLQDQERTFGRTWIDLKRLTHLLLISDCCRLIFDPRLLQHCPNLFSVISSDITREYQCQDIDPCRPACLRNLIVLAILSSYDPDDMYFIPPIHELKRSYGIQHEMTHDEAGFFSGCWMDPLAWRPWVCAYLPTMNKSHGSPLTRIFFLPRSSGDNTNSDDDTPVDGRPLFDRVLLSAFLNGLFLNLQVLNMKDWGGVQLQDFVEMIATGSIKLKNPFLFFERPSVKMMRAYRIFIEDESYSKLKNNLDWTA